MNLEKKLDFRRVRSLVIFSSAEKILEITLIKQWGQPNVRAKEFHGMIHL